MKTTPVKGTMDYLPQEMRVRDYLQQEILKTYLACGFERIGTPIIEDIENLNKSEGGENLNLIFKVLKRGEKFEKAVAEEKFDELADMGLRYDLTLPLTRYYANNRQKLPSPFKCIQIDRVYRAERPQKFRMREFVQCDIDIIGSSSLNCEAELINTTAKALRNIGFNGFRIKINDRRILRSTLSAFGFADEDLDSVCITFDKLDKIGAEGVKAELTEKNLPAEAIEKLDGLIKRMPVSLEDVYEFCPAADIVEGIKGLIENVSKVSKGLYEVVFDMSLVRGQGYYTGAVFEIESTEYSGAVGGGGRYDNLIGKFIGENIPAVGFSIGFERIAGILLDKGISSSNTRKRVVVVYDENQFAEAEEYAESIRDTYDVSLYIRPKKLGKLLDRLTELGYYGFYVVGKSEQIEVF